MRRLRGLLASASVLVITLAAVPASAQDLAPPPPMSTPAPGTSPGPAATTDPQQGDTTRKLDEAEKKDSGRNFELVWVDAMAGGSYIDMRQFSAETLSIDKASAGGPAFSLGAGLRFVVFVVGARARYNALSTFDMWQLNAEAGLKLPVGSFDILFAAHGGYSFAGRLGDAGVASPASAPSAADAVAVRGFNAGLDFAVDYYVTPLFSVGAGILGDFLFLNRPQLEKPPGFANLTPAQQAEITSSPLYSQSGSAAGLQLAGGLRLGLHFGL